MKTFLPLILTLGLAAPTLAVAQSNSEAGVAFNGRLLTVSGCFSGIERGQYFIQVEKAQEIIAIYYYGSRSSCQHAANTLRPAIAQNKTIFLAAKTFSVGSSTSTEEICEIDTSRIIETNQKVLVKGKAEDSSTSKKVAQEFKLRYGKQKTYNNLSGHFIPGDRRSYEESNGYVQLHDTSLDYVFQGLTLGLFGLRDVSKGSKKFTEVGVLFELDEAGNQAHVCGQAKQCVLSATKKESYDLAINKGRLMGCWN